MIIQEKNNLVGPVVKWVGGKRQLLDELLKRLPTGFATYYEPFVGGGALFFKLQPQTAVINDINSDLMRVYAIIKDDVDALVRELEQYRNDPDFFYAIRDWDRDKAGYQTLSQTQKAARILYLNKTCYNGLFRVNSSGEFNAPFGNYKKPNIVTEPVLRAVSVFFNHSRLALQNDDYAVALRRAQKGDFVYLDPPYEPVSDMANFTGYTKTGFDRKEQIRLKQCCDDLNARGIKFMLSNSAAEFIKEQYRDYNIEVVQAKRVINSVAAKRGEIAEVLIRNYE